jgi:hypothetical protein
MGRHSKPARIRIPQGATAAAAPTLASVALFLSPQAGLSPQPGLSAVSGLSVPAATAPPVPGRLAAGPAPVHPAVLAAALQLTDPAQAAGLASSTEVSAAERERTYRVRRGQSLSSIAGHFYHDRDDWPVIYWANHGKIRWADDIYVGEELRIPRKPDRIPPPPGRLHPPSRERKGRHRKAEHHHRHHHHSHRKTDDYYGGPVPGGAFGRCVVERESSRRPQVMNSSRHYGLYQFSESTWIYYGGKRSEFGHATVKEQNRVFATALRRHGKDNWIPYDHC